MCVCVCRSKCIICARKHYKMVEVGTPLDGVEGHLLWQCWTESVFFASLFIQCVWECECCSRPAGISQNTLSHLFPTHLIILAIVLVELVPKFNFFVCIPRLDSWKTVVVSTNENKVVTQVKRKCEIVAFFDNCPVDIYQVWILLNCLYMYPCYIFHHGVKAIK